MPPPRKISAAMQVQQQQQQCCQQMERENNNAEMHAEANEQPTNTANELIVVDLSSENTNFVNDTTATNNNMNVVSDIRSLGAAVAADSHVTQNIDNAVILQYEHNNYNNNNIVENELMHFDDIHIRHNNNDPRNRTNRLESRQIQPCNISEFSDNAHSSIFDTMTGNIVQNLVAEVNRAEEVGTPQVDRVCSGNATGGGDGIDGVSSHVLLASQQGIIATPNSELSNNTNNVLNQLAFAEAMELVTQNYLQQQTHHSRRSRSRRRRRHRGHGGRGGHQRHNQIRRSLKSMNKTLRKTVYTLRRIKSLLLQQVQIAREFHQNVLTA